MSKTTYVAPPQFYNTNHQASKRIHALPGAITGQHGQHEPAVAVMVDNAPRLVITAEAALRLAHEIADALEAVKRA